MKAWLHVTSHLGNFRLAAAMLKRWGSEMYCGDNCTKFNVSLFTNASDYTNETCMDRSMCLYLTNVVSLE